MQSITFYQRFESDILSGKKTITIRDESEKFYRIGSVVKVCSYEEKREFGFLKVLSVEPIHYNQLNKSHAFWTSSMTQSIFQSRLRRSDKKFNLSLI